MLALSSVLDVRRATSRGKRPKVQLTLPPRNSISSLSDSNPVEPPKPKPAHPSLSLRPFDLAHPSHPESAPPQTKPPASALALQPPTASEPDAPRRENPTLSDQELKDDVDQLIAHVDQEAAVQTSNVSPNSTTPSVPAASAPNAQIPAVVLDAAAPAAPANSSVPAPTNGTDSEVRLNAEEHFDSARKRLELILADDMSKHFVDENDLRTLRALALQATHGDCEQKSSAEGGSLFKTDAEAAANVDIERTDPLWGAWCIFMGSYKTDAMRDYVTKQRVVEEKITDARMNNHTTFIPTATNFDPSVASLEDVMDRDQQSALHAQTDRIMSHLREHDVRNLAALSLQATYGDCGPYGAELNVPVPEGSEKPLLRKLLEPLLEQTVSRKQGALWGAWCVLQGTLRSSAARDLTTKVESLVYQLTKSQAEAEAAQVAEVSTNTEEKTEAGLPPPPGVEPSAKFLHGF